LALPPNLCPDAVLPRTLHSCRRPGHEVLLGEKLIHGLEAPVSCLLRERVFRYELSASLSCTSLPKAIRVPLHLTPPRGPHPVSVQHRSDIPSSFRWFRSPPLESFLVAICPSSMLLDKSLAENHPAGVMTIFLFFQTPLNPPR